MTANEIREYQDRQLAASRAAAPEWTVGDRIRKIRRVSGLTQADFAKRVRLSKGSLAAWEADSPVGENSLMLLAARCQVEFGVPAWWTMGRNEPYDVLTDPDTDVRAAAEVYLLEEIAARRGNVRREGIEPPTRWLDATPGQSQVIPFPSLDHSNAPELPNVAPVVPLRTRSQHIATGIPTASTGV